MQGPHAGRQEAIVRVPDLDGSPFPAIKPPARADPQRVVALPHQAGDVAAECAIGRESFDVGAIRLEQS